MLTLEDFATSSGKYPSRLREITPQIKDNLIELLEKVTGLLDALEIEDVKVTSGYRSPSANANIKGASKTSHHMTGKAVDLEDTNGEIAARIKAAAPLLKTFGLWMEDPERTPGWCHLDIGHRTDREIRIFKP
jgi:uncharacterized protein YcbK (DUF882 family)